jgi:hypothetical protein
MNTLSSDECCVCGSNQLVTIHDSGDLSEDMNQMEDEDIQDMAYRIAEVLNDNGIDARQAEPILWTLLSTYTVY